MSRINITPGLMKALFESFNTLFQKGREKAVTYYTTIVTVVPSKGSKNVYGWLGQSTGFRKWVGERVIQVLGTHDFSIKNEKFENTVGVDEDQIADDEYGVLSPIFEQLGIDAAEHPDELVAQALKDGTTALCYDGKPFFATDHPVRLDKNKNKVTPVSNLTTEAGDKPFWYLFDTSKAVKPLILQKRKDYNFVRKDQPSDDIVFFNGQAVYGADARLNVGYALWQTAHACNKALTDENFEAVRTAMESIKGDNGRSMKIRAVEAHFPTSMRAAAERLFNTKTLANGGDNPLFGAVKVVINPNLD